MLVRAAACRVLRVGTCGAARCLDSHPHNVRKESVIFYFQYSAPRIHASFEDFRREKISPGNSCADVAIQGDPHIPGGVDESFPLIADHGAGGEKLALQFAVEFDQQGILALQKEICISFKEKASLLRCKTGLALCAQAAFFDLFFQTEKGRRISIVAEPEFFPAVCSVKLLAQGPVVRSVEIQAVHPVCSLRPGMTVPGKQPAETGGEDTVFR